MQLRERLTELGEHAIHVCAVCGKADVDTTAEHALCSERSLQLGHTGGGFGLRFLPPVRLEPSRSPGVFSLGSENRGPLLGCFSRLLEVRGLSCDALFGLTKGCFVLLGPEGGMFLDGFLGGALLRGLPERIFRGLPGGFEL